VQRDFQLPVISIVTLEDVIKYLEARGEMARELQWVTGYRRQYGVKKDAG